MAQTVGYMIAALGPLLMGSVHDAAAGWAVPLAMLAVLTTLQAVAGLWAGRAAYVGDRRRPAPF
jgi:CP family cyanate transporter-like MFS transporter